MWIKPWFKEVSLCAEVTAYVYAEQMEFASTLTV